MVYSLNLYFLLIPYKFKKQRQNLKTNKMNATFTKLDNGQILDTFLSLFSHMIVTRLYYPEYDDEGDFHAPMTKNIVIDKIQSPTKNIYLVDEFIEKRHNEILKTITK